MSSDCITCSKFAALVPRFTGGTSAISSSTIIFLIFRSEAKLGTIYHRLMFGMSMFDLMSSIAISFSTLPMPVDLPFPYISFYGSHLGNAQTCEAQGFVYVLGFVGVFGYNMMLFVYYTCAIAFQMEEKHIKRFVEPLLHIAPLALGLALAIPPLIHGFYNATDWDAWCTIADSENIEVDQDRTINLKMTNIDALKTNSCISFVGVICACIVLIVWRVFRVERALNNPIFKRRSDLYNKVTKSLQNTRVVLVQAMAYLLSFSITLGIILIRAVIYEPFWMIYLSFALIPLQGFFNALIFISHKVYNYRRVHQDVSRCTVVKLLFKGLADEPLLISRISRVQIDDRGRIVDVGVSNENGNENIHIGNYENQVSASQSGGHVFADEEESKRDLDGFSVGFSSSPNPNSGGALDDEEESKRDLDGFSGGFSSSPNPNSGGSGDEESKRDLDGLSGFSSELDSNPRADLSSRGGLSGFGTQSSPPQGRVDGTNNSLSPSLGAEGDISVDESNNGGSVLSRFVSMTIGNWTNQDDDLSQGPSVNSPP